MTFRCTRHFFLTRKESMIFEGLTLVVLLTGFSNFACIFWLQNREWLSLHSALLFPADMFFRTTKERMTFSCIRHHFLLLCMSFLTTIEWILFCVASDNIMHSSPSCACLFWRHFVASATIICFYVCLFWLQNVISALVCFFWSQKRGRQFVASVTFLVCLFWLQKTKWYLVSLEMLDALLLRKEKVVLAARHRHFGFTRGRIYYISICQGTLFFTSRGSTPRYVLFPLDFQLETTSDSICVWAYIFDSGCKMKWIVWNDRHSVLRWDALHSYRSHVSTLNWYDVNVTQNGAEVCLAVIDDRFS